MKEEFIKRLKEIQESDLHDTEMDHREADEVLCDLLIELGYEDVVKEFKKIDKWYS